MPRFLLLRALPLAALLTIGCDRQPDAETTGDAPEFDLEAIRRVSAQQNTQFTDAHVTGDIAAIDAMFLPDARSYPPGAPAAIGIDAIHALTVDFLSAGATERGKYINVWKHVNGGWRIQANIWNADPPDSTPKP